jgi:Hypervirulence associated proteins TUDOR domain
MLERFWLKVAACAAQSSAAAELSVCTAQALALAHSVVCLQNSLQVEGTVEKVITEDTKIKGFTAKASEEEPKVMVKSDKTGAKAAHKPESVEPLS